MSSNWPVRLWRDRRGTSAVEFAIVAPVFLAMVFGVFQLGWALHCNDSVDHAVAVAARDLVANPTLTQAQLQTQVQTLLTTIADPNNVTVTLTEGAAGSSPRTALVAASYKRTVEAPGLTGFTYTYKTQSTAVLSP